MADEHFKSDFEPDEPARGVAWSRADAMRVTGKSATAFDNWVRTGLPVRKAGGRVEVNSAELFDWLAARQRGGGEQVSAAKLDQIRVATRLKRVALAERAGLLLPTATFVNILGAVCRGVRNGVLVVPTQIADLAPNQRDALERALHDLLATVQTSVTETIRDLGGEVDTVTGEVTFADPDIEPSIEDDVTEFDDHGFEKVDGT